MPKPRSKSRSISRPALRGAPPADRCGTMAIGHGCSIALCLRYHGRDPSKLPRDRVHRAPPEDFYCPPEDVLAIEVRRGQRGHCSLIHHDTGFKADIYIAFDELHHWALVHRRTVTLDGLSVSVAPVEYVIVRKREYFRDGKSEKHARDIRGMLEVSPAEVDRTFLEQWIARLGLTAEWRRILHDA